ncbi:Sus1p NDAI_0A07950 [Naumovozyma dairenensis CBS 421]|uniref:Transcription and mRNA export factor SUS1 n=1 Tax=Naumovozyma dairenensis (strain ATCC 10597 / BCRC 20456 / CBS 421 / NBRC 0211 / NRRL Y-12639) TaxID=1071378 RepID=G0W561_NAUDC|nr:hypothetical protein NDAI_0A07950 [Naumovozyma dairenensis CBS 421]CCD22949.1 hypothetical protein NDAI_0A07950 [Naumovozyma dairenensis CBS 421]
MTDSASIKAQIQRYLVETGNYKKISQKLSENLLQEGWIDRVKRMTKEEIEKTNGTLNYNELLTKIEGEALNLVSSSTKEEALQQIRTFLSEIVETE